MIHVPRTTQFGLTLLAIPAIALALLTGCAEEKTTDRDLLRDSDRALEEEKDKDDDGEASDLAELAAKDVEHFRQMREAAAEQDADEEDDIQWNVQRRSDEPDEPETEIGTPSDFEPSVLPSDRIDLPAPDELDADATGDDEPILDEKQIEELIADLSRSLYREASYADMPLRELMLIAAMTMIDPDRAISPDAIPGLTDRERELLSEFQTFFRKLGEDLDGSRDAEEVLMESIEALRSSLRIEPDFAIGNLALCTRVGGFGDYDRFSKYSFLAHAEQQAIVYIEVDGFTSEVNNDGEWITKVSQQLVIYSDRDGIPVWREDWQTAVDSTRQKRGDFFLVQLITLPRALSVGRYQLKVRLRDETTGAEAEDAIHFEMVADPKMAVGGR